MRILAVIATVAGLLSVSAAPAGAVVDDCRTPAPVASPVVAGVPDVQRLYDFARVNRFATGAGIRVAVIDSGVDREHPQLEARGAVEAGRDLLRAAADGREDCNGHGTMVASIIAARPVPDVAFHGLAPQATIIPVRVSEQSRSAQGATIGDATTTRRFAQAITWAADPDGGDADVINLSVTTDRNEAAVREAVADALRRNVVVVAAVGNDGAKERGNPIPYPAAYSGVIGVGAVDSTGQILPISGHGDFVDIAAPGERITAVARRNGHSELTGTSAATPLVSATAALILQRYPGSTPRQVAQRIIATADPSPGGQYSDEYGYGILNPYRAVTEILATSPAPRRAVETSQALDPAEHAAQQRRAASRRNALMFAAAGFGAVLLIGLTAAVRRAGRGRNWRPGK